MIYTKIMSVTKASVLILLTLFVLAYGLYWLITGTINTSSKWASTAAELIGIAQALVFLIFIAWSARHVYHKERQEAIQYYENILDRMSNESHAGESLSSSLNRLSKRDSKAIKRAYKITLALEDCRSLTMWNRYELTKKYLWQ
jgi:Flp pilus assembly protein TadB